ncbi:hypothetical protein DL96DRAFT_1723153 [Flagelloscypha sp. PMI_526]|nr:hypothetical protein DL96DRAFT_1724249 [Flagelloscypha sp. PMI_526]KAH8795246.1 hypothetical protein DL96DRAFT_1723153 [Flagelloscypha sp. PMI_526]
MSAVVLASFAFSTFGTLEAILYDIRTPQMSQCTANTSAPERPVSQCLMGLPSNFLVSTHRFLTVGASLLLYELVRHLAPTHALLPAPKLSARTHFFRTYCCRVQLLGFLPSGSPSFLFSRLNSTMFIDGVFALCFAWASVAKPDSISSCQEASSFPPPSFQLHILLPRLPSFVTSSTFIPGIPKNFPRPDQRSEEQQAWHQERRRLMSTRSTKKHQEKLMEDPEKAKVYREQAASRARKHRIKQESAEPSSSHPGGLSHASFATPLPLPVPFATAKSYPDPNFFVDTQGLSRFSPTSTPAPFGGMDINFSSFSSSEPFSAFEPFSSAAPSASIAMSSEPDVPWWMHVLDYKDPRDISTSPFCHSQEDTCITWSNGWKSSVPYLPSDKGGNLLHEEEKLARRMAQGVCGPDSPTPLRYWKEYLPEDRSKFNAEEWVARIREDTANGFSVISRQEYAGTRWVLEELSKASMWSTFRVPAETSLQLWDAALRAKDWENPYMRPSPNLGEFIDNIDDLTTCRAAMSLTIEGVQVDGLNHVNEFATFGSQLCGLAHPCHPTVDSDLHTINTLWGLVHQFPFLTIRHTDSNGLGTNILESYGVKAWGRSDTGETTRGWNDWKKQHSDSLWGEQSKFETVFALPGDVIYQAPSVVHAVFTLTKAVTVGCHWLTEDAMHHTEANRRFDHTSSTTTTNTDHSSVAFLIRRMMIGLPRRPPGAVFRRRALIAHCLMIIDQKSYVSAESREAPSTRPEKKKKLNASERLEINLEAMEQKLALEIVHEVLAFLDIPTSDRNANGLRKILYPPTESIEWRNPGDKIEGLVEHLQFLDLHKTYEY